MLVVLCLCHRLVGHLFGTVDLDNVLVILEVFILNELVYSLQLLGQQMDLLLVLLQTLGVLREFREGLLQLLVLCSDLVVVVG